MTISHLEGGDTMTVAASKDKYEKILQASMEIIAEKGLQKTAVSEIVKRAGVAQGTFYLYFHSKNALIPAIAENLLSHTLEKIKVRVTEQEDFWSKLQVYIEETYAITNEHKEVLILCYSGMAFDYSMETWESVYQPFYIWFESILNQAVERNEILTTINIHWTAKMLINTVENAAERFYLGNDQDMDLTASQHELFQFLYRSLKF